MIIDILLVATGLIALFAASVSDIKTREVPDWVSYGLIFTGFLLRLIQSIAYNEWNYLFYGIIGCVSMIILGNLMFRTKQWGGGDTKLIIAVGITFATKPYYLPQHDFPFLVITIINILIAGAIYGIIYGIVLAVKNKKRFFAAAKDINKERKIAVIKIIALSFAIISTIIAVMAEVMLEIKIMMSILAMLLLAYPYLTIFIKAVEKSCLVKDLSVKKLTPGDWVEQDVYKNNKLIYKKKLLGIEADDIKRLIKASISKVIVKEGIPFIPPFFIGTLISVITGRIIGFI